MDFLGKKGEKASEEVNQAFESIEGLKSHLNALDNAVQHHDEEIDQVVEALTSEGRIASHVEDNADEIRSLKKVFRKFASIQSSYIENVDVLSAELDDVKEESEKDISQLETKVNRLKNSQDALFDELEGLKDRLDEIESEFILDTNRQEWDIESKVDESEFESHEKKVERELSKLRTSINDLSEKVDEEEIIIE